LWKLTTLCHFHLLWLHTITLDNLPHCRLILERPTLIRIDWNYDICKSVQYSAITFDGLLTPLLSHSLNLIPLVYAYTRSQLYSPTMQHKE